MNARNYENPYYFVSNAHFDFNMQKNIKNKIKKIFGRGVKLCVNIILKFKIKK